MPVLRPRQPVYVRGEIVFVQDRLGVIAPEQAHLYHLVVRPYIGEEVLDLVEHYHALAYVGEFLQTAQDASPYLLRNARLGDINAAVAANDNW